MKTAILLVNLGSPDAPTKGALKTYLRQFLSDKRVIEIPRLLWLPILHGIILNTRPKKSAAKYAQIWSEKGSPLVVHASNLADKLQLKLTGENIKVTFAMRYGNPAIHDVLQNLQQEGFNRICVLPLYPQYSASATASSIDEVCRYLQKMRDQPEIHFLKSYYNNPLYIDSLAHSVRAFWAQNGQQKLLMSFHGLPQKMIDAGDPYFDECMETAKLLAQALNLGENDYQISFQSRFGFAKWLQPSTNETLRQLAQSGVENVDVICPGFAADCLETLEEIAHEAKINYVQAGGKSLRMIPCLNDENQWVNSLCQITRDHFLRF